MTAPINPSRLETLPPTTAARPIRGTPLGSRYLVEHPIGEGSTGRVWRGSRRDDGSAVAIKILHAEYLPDPTMVARFRREGVAVRQLRHPHLVPVDDLVVERDTVAIVMELVNGDDLRSIMQRGRLETRRAVGLLAQVASALAHVHAAGVLHRDVKPENILVTRRAGQPWAQLSDFGLAWVASDRQLTRSTQLLGTPAYLAPELLAGRRYDPAVDVYALGVTAYELLTGRRPFDGEHPLAVMRAHLDDEAPRPPGMATDLWHLVRSCLAKRPEDRPTAGQLAQELESLARRRRILSSAPHRLRPSWRGRPLALVAAVLAAGLLAVPVTGWLRSPRPSRPPVAPAGAPPTTGAPLPSGPPGPTGPPRATGAPQLDSAPQTPTASPAGSAPATPSPPATVSPLAPAIGPIGAPGGLCLDDQAAKSTDGNPVQSWTCNNTGAQVWTVGIGGTLRVLNRCLRAMGTPDGAVTIWTCDATTAQRWQLRVGGGLLNVATGRCLESTGGMGSKPALRPCTGSAGQQWKLP